jgi:hypothetical protein
MKINGKHELLAQIARRGLLLAALLAMVLLIADTSRAQSNSAPAPTPSAKSAGTPATSAQTPEVATKSASTAPEELSASRGLPPAKGRGEGITVHGHWTIQVKNPDGKVVQTADFENSLISRAGGGSTLLAELLYGISTPGGWEVDLDGGAAEPCISSSAPSQCTMREPTSSEVANSAGDGCVTALGTGSSCYLTLNLALITNPGDIVPTKLQLSGTATVSEAGSSITSVSTLLYFCQTLFSSGAHSSAVSPQSCISTQNGAFGFTLATPTPITGLAAGQVVNVTVVFSFS